MTTAAGGPELPFLRIPPFPHAKAVSLARPGQSRPSRREEAAELLDLLAAAKVGGTYWGARPDLPEAGYVLTTCATIGETDAVRCSSGDDPWHMLAGARRFIAHGSDERVLVAAILGVAVECIGAGRFAALAGDYPPHDLLLGMLRAELLDQIDYVDPFTGEPIDAARAIAYCGFWRQLIDRNRAIGAAAGIAGWKRPTVEPMLWSGGPLRYLARTSSAPAGKAVAIWRSRCSPALLTRLEAEGAPLIEIEDGFIRSAGLGADCIPPQSIVVDPAGPHFDPARPSELEQMLADSNFPDELIDRARHLRTSIVAAGISKYSVDGTMPLARARRTRQILVPGQVEDDRSVVSGGCGLTRNLELLRRVRADAPDAHILYKPHPDVEAGHRRGRIPDALCLRIADAVVRDEPITALIGQVGEVQVNTSLAGFEALLRGRQVVTHGVPFYAGWGLTRDLGPVPPRRSRTLTLDQLVAAVLLLYPRYLDPVTGLPCPPEVLVERLTGPVAARRPEPLVTLRRAQGRAWRLLGALAP